MNLLHGLLTVLLVGCGFLHMSGCSSENSPPGLSTAAPSKAVAHAPVVRSARLVPNPIERNRAVVVEADGYDPDGKVMRYRYQWLANGRPIPHQKSGVLDPMVLKRGDLVQAVLTPSEVEGPSYRAHTALVVNTRPAIRRVTLGRPASQPGETIRAIVEGGDLDQGPVVYRFRWIRNGETTVEGDQSELKTAGLVRSDIVTVEVTPSME